jgi:hypothetical protein
VKLGPGIWMELGKREHGFIKHNIVRSVYSTGTNIQTFIPFVRGIIAKKDTLLGSKLNLMGIVWSKLRPTRTTRDLKPSVVRLSTKKLLRER